MTTSHKRRWTARRDKPQPDALLARDGSPVPVWSAEASDPVEHLATVLDQLKDSRKVAGR
ncbi:MAG: hypothetical protein ACJ72E_08010 [Marmoricola sp.]